MHARSIHINGVVQGVGFRPFVARLARELGCTGWVRNSAHGVEVLVQNENYAILDAFENDVALKAPPAARITSIVAKGAAHVPYSCFEIRASEHDDAKSTLISPDLATCDACLAELFDPNNPRYRYPFINCTNCGPRFTIIDDLPYDRPATSMREFAMCPLCAGEYEDEGDLRYHAQPNACFDCGPRLWLEDASIDAERRFEDGALQLEEATIDRALSDALIYEACSRLRNGDVLALKGLGGWHLACDATNEDSVRTLRERKRRPTKPLAIMVRDVDMARELAQVNDAQAALMLTPARPIVLVEQRAGTPLAPSVTCGLSEVGIMLPATPLQHLIMHELSIPLVMTSGNRSGEPIVARDEDAFEALAGIADALLGNNRKIVARYDDSVMRASDDEQPQFIRRARGFAPMPLSVASVQTSSGTSPIIFAAGPEQKATFALLDSSQMLVSQHLGDLEHLGAMRAWEEARARYERLFDKQAQIVACDMHPEYLASKWARAKARELDVPLVEVQHHHAHITSVLGENGIFEPVIGVALDGTGYGADGTIWGGEILIADRTGFERFWHLPTFTLPGGAAAIMNPERTAYALLKAYGELNDAFFSQFALDNPQFAGFLERLENRELFDQMIDKGLNSPLTSSAGRLFDATSALLGICTRPTYDGEAACLLEVAAMSESDDSLPLTAKSFHEGLINAIIKRVQEAHRATGIERVALSGGCMVNRILGSRLRESLRDLGFDVYTNRELPSNDGCIAYGQAIVAQSQSKE